MATRPPFDLKMTRTTFQRFYWYKTELQQLCRQYQLPTTGTKAELTQYLGQLLDGQAATQIKPIRPVHRTAKASLTADQITVETKLLASGFKLNQAARTFFASYFGVEKFVFRKAMGVKMRAVERDHDTTATVADLIAALADPTVIEPATEQTYQWNNFVKDFYRDSAVRQYRDPLKVAAILWQTVRDSEHKKVYQHQLLLDHAALIVGYLK